MGNTTTFPSDWSIRPLAEASIKIQDGTHFSPVLDGNEYRYITSRNIGAGHLRLDSVETISAEEHRKIFRRCNVRFGDLLLTKDGANTGNAAINTFHDEISLLSSVAFIRSNPKQSTEEYILQYFLSAEGRKQIADAMAGNAITRLTLSKIKALLVPIPPVAEQRKIADVLRNADGLIATLERLIAKKQAIKQGMMQQLLTGIKRLPGFCRRWQAKRLSELLAFEQPGRYLVSTSIQSQRGRYPVLTAGKTFVLGYTNEIKGVYRSHPAIIFDDFTTSSKYVDFDFKVKSSAIKILTSRNDANLRFMYERMQVLNFQMGDHKRYWISEYGKQLVRVPERPEQDAIARVLADADSEIDALHKRLTKAEDVKQGMMQELLTGRTRVPVAEVTA